MVGGVSNKLKSKDNKAEWVNGFSFLKGKLDLWLLLEWVEQQQ